MDNTIRKNEICVIGQPRCDFVFSSTRACFIAYGFEESTLEMALLRKLLEARGIQAVEAGGSLAPAQSAFCAKICSRIITAQFCAVFLNNEEDVGREIPNANVNMEYGLMLGFNKYVIPFQRDSQKLPFNVAGLDTVKYNVRDFEVKAAAAIDQAIIETQQKSASAVPLDQQLSTFLLSRKALYASVDNQGDKNLFNMGNPLGFYLLHDFSGLEYIYFGNFTMFRPEVILWRINMLEEILVSRASSIPQRQIDGIVETVAQMNVASRLLSNIKIWVVVTSNEDKTKIVEGLRTTSHAVDVFALSDVSSVLAQLVDAGV